MRKLKIIALVVVILIGLFIVCVGWCFELHSPTTHMRASVARWLYLCSQSRGIVDQMSGRWYYKTNYHMDDLGYGRVTAITSTLKDPIILFVLHSDHGPLLPGIPEAIEEDWKQRWADSGLIDDVKGAKPKVIFVKDTREVVMIGDDGL